MYANGKPETPHEKKLLAHNNAVAWQDGYEAGKRETLQSIRKRVPEKEKETWLNKDLVNTELEWALKAVSEMYKRGRNSAIDDFIKELE